MGKKASLSKEEQAKILELKDLGMSLKQIGRQINRHTSTITNFINDPIHYGRKRLKSGRKKKLTEREIRRIRRTASNSMISAAKIKQELNLKVSERTITRLLNNNSIKYLKMKRKPALKKQHKQKRLE